MSIVNLSSLLLVLAASSVAGLGCSTQHADGTHDEAFEKGPPPTFCTVPEDATLALEDPTASRCARGGHILGS